MPRVSSSLTSVYYKTLVYNRHTTAWIVHPENPLLVKSCDDSRQDEFIIINKHAKKKKKKSFSKCSGVLITVINRRVLIYNHYMKCFRSLNIKISSRNVQKKRLMKNGMQIDLVVLGRRGGTFGYLDKLIFIYRYSPTWDIKFF